MRIAKNNKGEPDMKKTISIICCIFMLVFTFSACSSGPNADMTEENITATVDTAFTALKEFNTEDLRTYVSSSTLSLIMSYAKNHTQFADLGRAMFENLTYEITAIDVENATVTLSVMNKDLTSTASSFVSGLLDKYSAFQLLNNLSSDTWLDSNLSTLTEDIDDAPMMSSAQEITLTVEQGEDNLTLVFDETAENGVSGGALGAIKSAVGV